jgi:hypothetical protein
MAKRYQREVIRSRISKTDIQYNGQKIPKGSNQKPDIKYGHGMQWPKDTKGVIRSQISKTDMHYNGQKIPKG